MGTEPIRMVRPEMHSGSNRQCKSRSNQVQNDLAGACYTRRFFLKRQSRIVTLVGVVLAKQNVTRAADQCTGHDITI